MAILLICAICNEILELQGCTDVQSVWDRVRENGWRGTRRLVVHGTLSVAEPDCAGRLKRSKVAPGTNVEENTDITSRRWTIGQIGLKVFIVEDNPGDTMLIKQAFNQHASDPTLLSGVPTTVSRRLMRCVRGIDLADLTGLKHAEDRWAQPIAWIRSPNVNLQPRADCGGVQFFSP